MTVTYEQFTHDPELLVNIPFNCTAAIDAIFITATFG